MIILQCVSTPLLCPQIHDLGNELAREKLLCLEVSLLVCCESLCCVSFNLPQATQDAEEKAQVVSTLTLELIVSQDSLLFYVTMYGQL